MITEDLFSQKLNAKKFLKKTVKETDRRTSILLWILKKSVRGHYYKEYLMRKLKRNIKSYSWIFFICTSTVDTLKIYKKII